MENSLFITSNAYDGLSWLGRPICMVIGIMIVLTLVLGARWRKRLVHERRLASESQTVDPAMAVAAIGLLLAFSIWGLAPTFSWATDVGGVPMVTFIPAICLSLFALGGSVRDFRRVHGSGGDVFPGRRRLKQFLNLHLWWGGLVGATIIAGQLVAFPLFVALHVRLVVGHAWWIALLCAGATWAFLHLLFDRMIAVIWYPSMLFY